MLLLDPLVFFDLSKLNSLLSEMLKKYMKIKGCYYSKEGILLEALTNMFFSQLNLNSQTLSSPKSKWNFKIRIDTTPLLT